jgi:hypothetical protein
MANRIDNIATRVVKRDGQKTPVILLGLGVDDLGSVDQFMTDVVTTFRNHRMISPPETSVLLVTLVGALDAQGFKERWAREVEGDPVVGSFMQKMTDAAVLSGTADGKVLGAASLL